jgi:MSHA biogenesis protein MshE
MLEMNEDMLDALRRKDVSDFTRAARRSPLFRPLGQCAMDYALQGVTSLQEVARVAATTEGALLEGDDLAADGAIGVDD